jgi:sugar lactone lactonase YvrE
VSRILSTTALLALAALAAGGPAVARAASAPGFRHEKSIYVDAAEVPLRNPEGVACDERGAVVIADTGNARLLTYTWKDGALEGGTQVKVSQLGHPVRVQIDSKGFVLALDRKERRIVRLDASGKFAGYLEPRGASSPVSVSAFKLDGADAAYLLDLAAHRVVVVAADGRVEREIPLPVASGITDLAVDASKRIYLVDAVKAVVYAAEKGASSFQPLSESLKASMSFPTNLASDNHGKLYVADQNGNAIVRLGVDGKLQSRELATGWSDGALYYPAQLCLTGDGDLVVADRNNNRVQIFAVAR